MKTTRIITVLLTFLSLIVTDLFAQKDLVISGGNTVSSFVCSNRKVYTWGNNKTTAGTGLLGSGGTADYYTSPQPVNFPGGVDITQVNSGSGSHFVALDCNRNPWSWGNNSLGQVGNGVAKGENGFEATPQRVKVLPEIAATHKNASNELINVSVVYAGNNSSFAILDNGDLVSWGANGKGFNAQGYDDAYGQLGNGVLPAAGTTANQTAAGYVKVPGGGKLTGVIQVFAGDNFAMALADPDGDGVGTVYTWGDGKSGTLARNAAGTLNPSSGGEEKDPWARPARYKDGTIMNNITQIYAGDVFGAALDVNGYIWTWGNGGWNNSTGSTTTNYTGSDPQRVLKGTTTGASNDGTYLLAKMIGAGQGYGMAVTADNKPVAWGGGGYADGGGFSGGSSTSGPEYITYAAGSVHNDVILINRGDTWGFYGRADGSMWAWGRNAEGQLGIGGAVSNEVLQATKINPPTGCGFKDPLPYVDLSPGDMTVCATSFTSQVLDAGFVIGTGLAASYRIDWYKGTNLTTPVSTGNGITGKTYTATSPDKYTVKVTYIGTNSGCDVYDPAIAEMTISTWPATFTAPTNLTYCGDSATVNVSSTNPKGIYDWFHTNASSVVRGTTIGSGTTKISIIGATAGTGTDKIVYVEEKAYANGLVLRKNQGCAATWFTGDLNLNNGTINQDNSFATGYTISEAVTITELSFMFRSSLYTVGNSGTATIEFGIYRSRTNNGGLVADNANMVGVLTATYNRTRGAAEAQDLDVELTATGNVALQPGTYFIGIRSYNGTGLNNPKVGRGNCALPAGIVDDFNGTIIRQNIGVSGYGNPNQNSTGFDFNVKFKTAQRYCTRVPVTLKESCPCNTPANVTITTSDADTTLCSGQSLTLTSNAQANTTMFDFTVYKGSVAPANIVAGPTANISSISRTVAYADAGTYIILVRDKAMPTQTSCQKQASILVKTAPNPTATISGGGSFCQGATVTPVTITLTGTGPFTYTYDPGATVRTNQAGTTYSPTAPTAVGTYNYKVTALQDKYCTAAAGDITSTGSIEIKPVPTVTAANNGPICAGQPLNLTSTATAGSTFAWAATSYTSTVQNPTRTPSTTAMAVAHTVTATLNGCTATATTTPVINPIPATPTVTITSPCEGAALNISTPTVSGATYTWTTPDGFAPGNVASFSRASATTAMNGTYSVTVTVNSCTSTAGSASATVNPTPAAPVVPTQDLEYCVGETATAFQATALAGHTLQWYTVATGGTASTTAPTPTTTAAGTFVRYVAQRSAAGCEGPRATITATIFANPTVTATATPATICAGLTSAIVATPAGGVTPYTYAWTGAGASKLNSTSSANPTYTSLATDPTASNALNIEVTDAKGCKGTASTAVQVNGIPAAPTAGSNAPICEGLTLNLTASNITGATYAWTGPASYTAATQNPTRTNATTAMSGTYSVTATVAGCTGPAGTVNVTINAIPAAPTASNPSYCVNSAATPLTATGSNLKWYTVATGGTALAGAPTPITTAPGTFNWWVSQTVNGCESARTQVTVTVNNSLSPSISATPSFTECAGTAINISVPGTFSTIAWTGTAAAHLSSTALANPIFSASAPAGTYTATITVSDANGCSGSATQTITIKPIPATPVVTTTPICAGKTLNISTPTVATATYAWTTPDAFNPGSVASFTRTNATTVMAGSYGVTVTVDGCTSALGSATAVVNANPTITLTPSRPLACKSGNNSTAITMNTTGTSGGTLVYSSTPAGVNTSTGAIDPATAAVGSYNIKLVFTDGNGCKDSTTTTAEVKAIPTVSFGVNPATMCTYDAAHTMVVNPVAVAPATGIFSGSITTSSFNPSAAAVGANAITYTYRDSDGCENVANTSITVVSIDPPTVTSGNPKSLVVQVDDTFLPGDNTNLTATGAYTLQWMDPTCATVNGTGGTYATGKGPLDLGSFTYKVRQRDAVSGCASVCVDALLAITKCPALTPSAIDPFYCVGEATPLTVTATANGPQAAGDKLTWFATSNTGGAPILDNNATYSEAISTAAPTTKTVYVAQYNAANTCYSQPKAVTINVVANPTVTLTAPANVCAVSGLVNITTTPAGGTLTGTGATGLNAAARTWDPMNGGAPSPSKTLNLTYVVTETHPDGKVCSTTETASTTAHFMAPPVPEHKNWLIGDIANIPNNHMTASVSGTGTLIKWYNDQAMASPRAQAPFATATNAADKTALTTEIGTPLPQQYTKSYWITQTDAQGCESEPVQVDLVLVNCPFTAPTVVGEEACVGATLDPITAAKPATMTENVDEWRWYTSSSATTPTYTAGNSFAHGVSNATAGTTTFYVSYLATETTTSKQCESPRTAVTVKVNPLPTITFNAANKTLVCYDQGVEQLLVAVNDNGNGVGTGVWEVDGATAGITSAGVFDPTFKGQVTGTYPIEYTYTDGKGCVNSATSSIKVQYMPAPTTVDYTWITTQPQPVVISAGGLLGGATVKWYTDADVLIPTATNPFTTSDDPTVEIVKTYKASQVVDGCESPKTPAIVTLTKCPFGAPTVIGEEKCAEQTLNPISAAKPVTMTEAVKEWKWYTAPSGGAPVYTSTTSGVYNHTVSNTASGTTTFYVSYVATETVSAKDCESPRTAVTVVVNPLPEIVLTVPALVCQDAGDVVLSAAPNFHSNGAGTGTWSVDGAAAGITTGGVFKPDFMGEVSGTYTIGYSYTDGKGCTKLETEPIEVQFTPAPTTVGHLSMTIANATVKVEATSLEPLATVQWYDVNNNKLSIPTATDAVFFTGDLGNVVTNKIYRATQIVQGCESKKTDATVVIIDCPVPAPQVAPITPICDYDATPEITATIGSPWGAGLRPTPTIPVEFRYYTSASGPTPIASNTTGLYTPIISKASAGTHTFYVSEYNANIVPQGCEGPRTAVTITVKKVLPATLNSVQDVCAAPEGTNPTFTAYDYTGTIEWHTTTPPTPATNGGTPGSANYQPTFTATGSHTVWAVVRADGCVSTPVSGSYVIKPIPAAPAITGNQICVGEANTAISATGNDIKWYQNANRTGFLVFSQTYTPTVTSDNVYTFHASQTVDGCESQTTPATYTIKPRPAAPMVAVSPNSICEYETDPNFTATPASGGTINWYETDGTTFIQTGTSLTPVRPAQEAPYTIKYFASQTVNGCEGTKNSATLQIKAKPKNPIPSDRTVCEGQTTSLPAVSTQNATLNDKWYDDDALSTQIGSGYSYQVQVGEFTNVDRNYYVLREIQGCRSDIIPVKLAVIKKPTFTIGNDVEECAVGADAVIEASGFNPAINANSTITWAVNKTGLADNPEHAVVPASKLTINPDANITNTVYALYRYKDASGITCLSDTISVQYKLHRRARTPIVAFNTICQGAEIQPLQAYGSPNVVWESKNGLPTSYGQTYNFTQLGITELPIGFYTFDLYDRNIIIPNELECPSEIADNKTFEVAPAAVTNIIGDSLVCVNTIETMYMVETAPSKQSNYVWSVTGNRVNYSKDGEAVRYIDWDIQGVDTITVYENTYAGCEGFDTLIVKVANYPVPHFSYTMPGASNVVEFLDSTTQKNVIDKLADGTVVEYPVTYTMYWNYGKTDDESWVDSIVEYEDRLKPVRVEGYVVGPKFPILTVENSFGCKANYTEQIYIESLGGIYMPTAFAPNNPAYGVRYFHPVAHGVESCEVWVYDVWGNLVWYSNEVKDGIFVGKWDGTYNGEMLKSDTYIWKMEANYMGGNEWTGVQKPNGSETKFGSVVLLR